MKYLVVRGIRKNFRWLLLAGLGMAGWLLLARRDRESSLSEKVLLLPAEAVWNPTEPLEVRFDQVVASEDIVGLGNQAAPIILQPRLPGNFLWLSQRHGVFRPATPPLRGTRIRVTLAPSIGGTIPQDNRPRLERNLMVAPFAAEPVGGSFSDARDVPLNPSYSIRFNELVKREQES